MMKTISKVLVRRLRPLLSDIISKNQSSFIPGIHATNNIIIAQEAIHTMRMMKRTEGAIAIKKDLKKAYDKLKWKFLQEVLKEIRLPDTWVSLIMFTIKTPTFSIFWNG